MILSKRANSYKEKYIECILEYKQFFEITEKNSHEEATKEYLQTLTIKELYELLTGLEKELSKIIGVEITNEKLERITTL